jgi:hypothetical protein
MTPYYCPNCHAQCRTPDAYDIHFKRCRAMSLDEMMDIFYGPDKTVFSASLMDSWGDTIADNIARVHARHIAKLRGKKP